MTRLLTRQISSYVTKILVCLPHAHKLGDNNASVDAMKPKSTYRVRATALLFYIPTSYHTILQSRKLKCRNVCNAMIVRTYQI